jgi:ubiquinone/menaquinone biosynthesis C-methylase UbiE
LADLILLVTVFHEVSNSEVVLKEFDRILKPSGRLAIVEVTKKHICFCTNPKPRKNVEKLKQTISNFKSSNPTRSVAFSCLLNPEAFT